MIFSWPHQLFQTLFHCLVQNQPSPVIPWIPADVSGHQVGNIIGLTAACSVDNGIENGDDNTLNLMFPICNLFFLLPTWSSCRPKMVERKNWWMSQDWDLYLSVSWASYFFVLLFALFLFIFFRFSLTEIGCVDSLFFVLFSLYFFFLLFCSQWCAPCDYNCPAINFAKPVYKWSIWNILFIVIFRSLLNQPSTSPNEFRLAAVTFFQIALYRRSLQDDCRATLLWLNLLQFSPWTISEKM